MDLDDPTLPLTNTPSFNSNVPVDPDMEKIVWDGNRATLAGALHRYGRFLKRKGLFRALLQHRAAPLSGGRLAIDSVDAMATRAARRPATTAAAAGRRARE